MSALSRETMVNCYSGVTRTLGQLNDAFDQVKNKGHWKFPIDAIIDMTAVDEDLYNDAIVHYTGGVATFTYIGEGLTRITALGYYNVIGA